MNNQQITISKLDFKRGLKLREIKGLSSWAYENRARGIKTHSLARYLRLNGAVFRCDDVSLHGSELGDYLPAKKSIGLDLSSHMNMLKKLYVKHLEQASDKKLRLFKIEDGKVCSLDYDVFKDWCQGITGLEGLAKTALMKIFRLHPQSVLMYQARKDAYSIYKQEPQLELKQEQEQEQEPKQLDLFSQIAQVAHQESDHQHVTWCIDQLIDICKEQQLQSDIAEQQIRSLQEQVAELKDLLNIRVQDMLKALR